MKISATLKNGFRAVRADVGLAFNIHCRMNYIQTTAGWHFISSTLQIGYLNETFKHRYYMKTQAINKD